MWRALSGVGKTHLAVACLKDLIRPRSSGLFCDYRELLKDIRLAITGSESLSCAFLEPIRTGRSSVVDDLGASKPSAWVLDTTVCAERTLQRTIDDPDTTNYLDTGKQDGNPHAPRKASHARRPRRYPRRTNRRTHALTPVRNVPNHRSPCPPTSRRESAHSSRARA